MALTPGKTLTSKINGHRVQVERRLITIIKVAASKEAMEDTDGQDNRGIQESMTMSS